MRKYLFTILLLFFFIFSFSEEKQDKEFDPAKIIFGHIQDAHDFHIMDIDGHAISLSLPIILKTKKGFTCFFSSKFHHNDDGSYLVEKNEEKLVKHREKIYYATENPNEKGQYLNFDEKGNVLNEKPLDLSITKNVFSGFVSIIIILLIMISVAKGYKKRGGFSAPRGVAKFLEPLISFVVYDIIKENIGEKKYMKYVPFLLTLFFFIFINNLIGIIPFFPFSANLTGNISFTFAMAFLVLLFIIFSGNKNYWTHIFATPGVPFWLTPIMIPIELMGIITKPFALMVRLFANITAGHIVILSLVSLIFILKTLFISPVSILFLLFMNLLELLVAFIQAYIFTMLSSLFIGQAVEDHH